MSGDLARWIGIFFNLLTLAIFARAILSFFDPGMRSSVGRLLVDITEPIVSPIRRVVPPLGMIDLSPLIAMLLLQLMSQFLTSAVR